MRASFFVKHWRPLAAGLTAMAAGYLGWALPLGLGLQVQVSILLALLGAARAGAPWLGALVGAMAGAAGGLPSMLAHAAAMALASQRMRQPARWWRFSQAAVESHVVLVLLTSTFQALFYWDGAMLPTTAYVQAIALLPGALVLAALLPFALEPWAWRYAVAPLMIVGSAFAALGSAPLFPPGTPPAPVAGIHAGAALADITPTTEKVFLGGYGGRSGPAVGASEPLYVRVFMVQEGSTQATFISVDAVGMGNHLASQLRAAAGGGNAFVSSTHSHAGPDLQGIWGGAAREYEERLVEATRKAVAEATAGLRPATLTAGAAELDGLQHNRRGWPETPRRLSVLQAKAQDGKVIGTLVNFGVHPTVLPRENMQAGPDFTGALTRHLDSAAGGVTVYINGAQGDVTPKAVGDGAPTEKAQAYGKRLGEEAARVAATAAPVPAGARLTVAHTDLKMPLANWGFQALTSLGMLRYDMPVRGALPSVVTRVSLVRIGADVAILTAPGEVTTRLAARVDQALGAKVPFLLGLTHDSLGYLILRDEWNTGRNENYEESVAVGPQAGEDYLSAVTRLTR